MTDRKPEGFSKEVPILETPTTIPGPNEVTTEPSEEKSTEIVEKCDPKKSPWGDLTDPFNYDGQDAIQNKLITAEGGITRKGHDLTHASITKDDRAKVPTLKILPDTSSDAQQSAKMRPDNRLLKLEDVAKSRMQILAIKFGYETTLRKTDGGGYLISILVRSGGNNRPNVIKSFKGVSPLDCYEHVLEYLSEKE
ncbi:MAG: hypothetical protein Q7S24_00960 [bacterium]|nr:hypothetical protein [bacterium]